MRYPALNFLFIVGFMMQLPSAFAQDASGKDEATLRQSERKLSSGGGSLELPSMGGPLRTVISWVRLPGDPVKHYYLKLVLKADPSTALQVHATSERESGKKFIGSLNSIVAEGLAQRGADFLVLTTAPLMESASHLSPAKKNRELRRIARTIGTYFSDQY